jgi:hypothetical protein
MFIYTTIHVRIVQRADRSLSMSSFYPALSTLDKSLSKFVPTKHRHPNRWWIMCINRPPYPAHGGSIQYTYHGYFLAVFDLCIYQCGADELAYPDLGGRPNLPYLIDPCGPTVFFFTHIESFVLDNDDDPMNFTSTSSQSRLCIGMVPEIKSGHRHCRRFLFQWYVQTRVAYSRSSVDHRYNVERYMAHLAQSINWDSERSRRSSGCWGISRNTDGVRPNCVGSLTCKRL